MDLFEFKSPRFIDGRKQPIGYRLRNVDGPALSVIGHYETACGGCDTIHSFDEVFHHVRSEHEMGYNVLFEGVLLYCEMPHTIMLHVEGIPFQVIALDTSLEECVYSVNLRRVERGDWEPVNPANTETKWKGTKTSMKRLVAAGVPVHWENRESAYLRLVREFNLNPAFALL